jgi:hypothetical protein
MQAPTGAPESISANLGTSMHDRADRIPAQGNVYWNGEGMSTTDDKDHFATLLKNDPYPA